MNYETFFSDWMKRYGAPPSARDFSDDKKEQAGFRYWARKNGLALASKQNSESFQTFYREYLQEYGKPGPVMPWIFAELKKRGFSTFGRENNIEICPPLTITAEELNTYLPILDEVLTLVDERYTEPD